MTQRKPNPLHAVSNPPNRFRSDHLEWEGPPPEVELQVFEDRSRSVLSRNNSPDLPFTWSLNPYRGCMHACAYCYARPSHEFLDFGAGTDFDRKIVTKPDVARLLRATFEKASWKGELILFSGNTDCYQPLESHYRLTRQCLKVCAEYRNPVALITKSALVERDIDILMQLQEHARCFVTISVPFMCPDKARRVEPFAPTPKRRIRTIERLVSAGISTGVNVAPIIPGLNDEDIPAILAAARAAGACRAGHTLVRLPGSVSAVFTERIRAAFPDRAERILNRIKDTRSGRMSDNRFGSRMRGQGPYWEAISTLFEKSAGRLGFDTARVGVGFDCDKTTFERPSEQQQLDLFGR